MRCVPPVQDWRRVIALVVVLSGAQACRGSSGTAPVGPSPTPQAPSASLVLFDHGHFNFHRLNTTYAAFARLLSGDGWTVEAISGPILSDSLRRARLLVIVSPLAQQNANPNNWTLPTPSAFTSDEIAVVRGWVEGGGGLLLITDHMPFPGAIEPLAAVFGARFSNGFAFDPSQLSEPKTCLAEAEVHVFRRADGSLADHPITAGIDTVATFTGSAFEIDGAPLMTFNAASVSVEPQTAWVFLPTTPRISVAGWRQGAAKQFGQGRVVIFGEAAMFTEQTCGAGTPMGMTSPLARQNSRLLLNVLAWLGGRLG